MSNKLTNMARELLAIEEDLPHRFNYSADDRPTINDFDLYTFEQTWASTALGFGGIGGDAMTTARTYVFVPLCNQKCFVYFAGRFAYAVDYTEAFVEDLQKQRMEPISRSGKYIKKE